MKNLVAKVGTVTTATLLATAIAPVMEAEALVLNASRTGTIVRGQANSSSPVIDQELLIFDPFFADAGAVEVGEFLFNESRAFAEYDLSSFSYDPNAEYTLGFNVFTKGGTNSAGSSGLGNNKSTPGDYRGFDGNIFVEWFSFDNSVFNPINFDPLTPIGGNVGFSGFTRPANPLAVLDMSTYSEGDRIELDVSSLVKDLLFLPNIPGFNSHSLGIMLYADPTYVNGGLGNCGANAGRACLATTFNNFGIDAVPTPAAILPSLLGIASATFRRKRNLDNELN